MPQINLSPKQVEDLKNHYILELEKLQQRSAEIMNMLSALMQGSVNGGKLLGHGTTAVATKGNKKIAAAPVIPIGKRRGRPSNNPHWSEFVIRILQEAGKPMTRKQIIKAYEKEYKVIVSKSPGAMIALNQAMQRLRVKLNLITSTRRKGVAGKLYSLTGTTAKPETKLPKEKAKQKKQRSPRKATKARKVKQTPKTAAKPVGRPKVKPAPKAKAKRATKPRVKPVTKPAEKVKPVVNPKVKPAPKPKVKVAPKPKVKVAPKPKVKVAPKPKVKVAPKPKVKAAKPGTKPMNGNDAKPASQEMPGNEVK